MQCEPPYQPRMQCVVLTAGCSFKQVALEILLDSCMQFPTYVNIDCYSADL